MNQDQDKKMQNQNKQPGQGQGGQTAGQTGQGGGSQNQGKPEMNERGNPSTTERVQPEPNRTGKQPEGDKPTGNQQPKF